MAYVNATGIVGYLQTPGNLGAIVATRDIDAERTEIMTLSGWEVEVSIKAFAGSNSRRLTLLHRLSVSVIQRLSDTRSASISSTAEVNPFLAAMAGASLLTRSRIKGSFTAWLIRLLSTSTVTRSIGSAGGPSPSVLTRCAQ